VCGWLLLLCVSAAAEQQLLCKWLRQASGLLTLLLCDDVHWLVLA